MTQFSQMFATRVMISMGMRVDDMRDANVLALSFLQKLLLVGHNNIYSDRLAFSAAAK